jgi:hypothetical protein
MLRLALVYRCEPMDLWLTFYITKANVTLRIARQAIHVPNALTYSNKDFIFLLLLLLLLLLLETKD